MQTDNEPQPNTAAQASNEDQESPYRMQIDMRVLDHLGIRLYSNAAAVLSEAVANAWDADTQKVTVTIDQDKIVIEDDGVGMDLAVINDRFLAVGYDKRTHEGSRSAKGRLFMGRKGIGKLSLFSIAEEVTVHTNKNGEQHAFLMSTSGIEKAISQRKIYHPKPVTFNGPTVGTRIVLTNLKPRRVGHTEAALRKRIARRFSIIGYESPTGDKFDVVINQSPITAADRDDLQRIEFLWEFDKATLPASACPALLHREVISNVVAAEKPGWRVKGWLAAAARPKDLRSDEAGTMNGIVVVARGRLIQENILDRLSFNRILNSYITGQVEADFLDTDEEGDIATSDRQRLIEDDERYMALLVFLRRSLVDLSDEWTRRRNETRGKEVQTQVPALADWIMGLPAGQQVPARTMLGVIQGVELDDEADRRELYKAGVLAFERLRLREASHRLGEMQNLTAATLLPLLSDLTSLEGSMYRDIVRERLAVITKFTGLVDANEKEKVLQESLFDQMWLLDPGWERATGSERMEERLRTEYGDFASDLTDAQSKGRVDIRYRSNAGEHIIVELKRAGRVMTVPELQEQGFKYRSALTQCLKKAGGRETNPSISIVFVLGRPVAEEEADPRYVTDSLRANNARIVYYESLIASASAAYAEFLERSQKADAIDALITRLDS